MKFIVAHFMEETNSFSPNVCTRTLFESGAIRRGSDVPVSVKGTYTMVEGMLDTLKQENCQAVCSGFYASGSSSGKVDRAVYEEFMQVLQEDISAHPDLDGVILSLHGATSLTDEDDACGLLCETVRSWVGESKIISVSTDFHANITQKMMQNADIVCGFRTYPHMDYYTTGQRAASLAVRAARGNTLYMTYVKLPMLHQAEASVTTRGPMKKVMDTAAAKAKELGLLDYSVYQMQPWLDAYEGGACVLCIGEDRAAAGKATEEIARVYFDLRKEITFPLHSVDTAIEAAAKNTRRVPVVLSDSADSPSAGATGDSTVVLSRLLEVQLNFHTLMAVTDRFAPALAEKVGVGNVGTFALGGTFDTERFAPVTVEARVRSIHEGIFTFDGRPDGYHIFTGKTAVLQVGKITILVGERPCANYTPYLYKAFGLEPAGYDLVVVKSALQFRDFYEKITDLIYHADTAGASSPNLHQFDFQHLPRPIYPFENVDGFTIPGFSCARGK